MATRLTDKIRDKAWRQLCQEYPEEFQKLFSEEKAKEGIVIWKTDPVSYNRQVFKCRYRAAQRLIKMYPERHQELRLYYRNKL